MPSWPRSGFPPEVGRGATMVSRPVVVIRWSDAAADVLKSIAEGDAKIGIPTGVAEIAAAVNRFWNPPATVNDIPYILRSPADGANTEALDVTRVPVNGPAEGLGENKTGTVKNPSEPRDVCAMLLAVPIKILPPPKVAGAVPISFDTLTLLEAVVDAVGLLHAVNMPVPAPATTASHPIIALIREFGITTGESEKAPSPPTDHAEVPSALKARISADVLAT